MERSIRLGKDFNVLWSIRKVVDGERQPYELAGKELVLQYRRPNGTLHEAKGWRVDGNIIIWPFRGRDQKAPGLYGLILTENGGKDGMVTVDTCRAFNLVEHSCEETEGSGSDIVIEDVVLESEVAFAPIVIEGGGGSYDDTEIKNQLAALQQKDAEQSAKLAQLSEEINGVSQVTFDAKAGVGLVATSNKKPFYFKKGEFSVRFASDAVSTTYVNIYLYNGNQQQIGKEYITYKNEKTYNVEEDVAYVGVYMPSNQVVKDGEVQIIIEAEGAGGIVGKIEQLESEVGSKMSGELVGVGKNLYNDKVIKDGYINVTQTQGAKPNYQGNAAGGYGHSLPIPVIGGLTYYIGAESVCAGFYKMFLDNQGNVVELVGAKDGAVNTANNISIVAPTNAAYLVLTTRFGGKDCVNLQVELGETATLYEPYKEGLSLPIELLPTYVQEATFAALEDKPKVARLEALLMGDGQKVYASAGDSLTEGTGAAVGAIDASDNYYPLFGRAQKTYAYMIAKRNNMAWCNYGISGSTMANITFNGQSHAPFCVDRYANMADNIDVISLWFGVNDSYYGRLAKAEEWLVKTYGKKMYLPLSASLQGTTAADGTPYATNEQYMACITAEEEFNGTKYKGLALYRKQFEGLPTDTDDTTWWGAWNKVLPYLIEKYPFAKIVIITGYGTEDNLYESVNAISEKYGVLHLDLREYGVTWLNGSEQPSVIDYDAADFADRTYFKEYASGKVSVNEFRKRTMLYDGLHFNKYGYEYITPFIEKALNL